MTTPAGQPPAPEAPGGSAGGASSRDTDRPGPRPDPPEGGLTTDITPGPGGVMTDEVGVVTGPLTLRTTVDGCEVAVQVQYKDADEWYAVTGARATLADPADARAVHAILVGVLDRPEG